MSARRVWSIAGRDLKSSLRDVIAAWVLVFPPILALIARLLVPAVGGATVKLVATPGLGDALVDRLAEYAAVEVVPDRPALDSRVLGLDAAVGLVAEEGGYRLVLEGNEGEEAAALAAIILADSLGERAISIRSVDRGRTGSPVTGFVAVLFAMMSLVLAGSLMSLSVVEDKETGSIHAIAVAPLSRREYLAGKGILGLGVALLNVSLMLYLIGAGPFDPAKVLVITLAGFVSAALVGFYVGAISDNQVSAIAGMKTGNLLFLLVPLLTLALPDRLESVLYPLPTYWTFLAYRGVLVEGAGWPEVLRLTGINLVLSLALVAVSVRFLGRRLSLRG
ncbi:MAG: ABC transporter permease [bacterium]|nr:ABC transporter permease [bacterium]